jgi:predicted peptidase
MRAAEPFREYRDYPSSQDASLRLYARFAGQSSTGLLLVKMHGWHGQVKTTSNDNIPDPADAGFFTIAPEMRGRGDATGQPDCNGWELQDVIDAVQFARQHYRDRIAEPQLVYISGGSGGGGNVFALLGKFPDFFAAARATSGVSDYALWHAFDRKGEFRDELEGSWEKNPRQQKAWIGGTPETNPEGYRSRGGLTTVTNLLTPTIVFHGGADERVPALHARLWVGAAHGLGKGALIAYHEFPGVGDGRDHYAHETAAQRRFRLETGTAFLGQHRSPPALLSAGRLIVAGYLKTARFEVVLDSIDHVAQLDYDLAALRFELRAANARAATLRVRNPDGTWRSSPLVVQPDPVLSR